MYRRTTTLLALSALVAGVLGVTASTSARAVDQQPESVQSTTTVNGTGFGLIPDGAAGCVPGAPRDVAFQVAGVPGDRIVDARVIDLTFDPSHTFVGDLTVTLIAPNGDAAVLFSRTGAATTASVGDSSNVAGPYTFADDASQGWWAAATGAGPDVVLPSGAYRSSAPGGTAGATGEATLIRTALAGVTDVNGTWTLRTSDRCALDTGGVSAAKLRLTVLDCTSEEAAVTAAESGLATASTALTAAQAAATQAAADVSTAQQKAAAAQQAVASASSALDAATAAVTKAEKKLAKAKKAGNRAKVKKAKKGLKTAKAALQAAQSAYGAAMSANAAATAALKGASEKQAAAQQQVTKAQAGKAAAQSALTAAQGALTTCQTVIT